MSGYDGKRYLSRCQDGMMVKDIFLICQDMMVTDIFLSGEYDGKGYVSRCKNDMMVKDIFLGAKNR